MSEDEKKVSCGCVRTVVELIDDLGSLVEAVEAARDGREIPGVQAALRGHKKPQERKEIRERFSPENLMSRVATDLDESIKCGLPTIGTAPLVRGKSLRVVAEEAAHAIESRNYSAAMWLLDAALRDGIWDNIDGMCK